MVDVSSMSQLEKVKKEKTLNANKLLTRLSILLAEIRAGHNSNKLKNETRFIYFINIIKSLENCTLI